MNKYNIHLDETYYASEFEEMTIYFTADASLIHKQYPDIFVEVFGTEISVAFYKETAEEAITLADFYDADIKISPIEEQHGVMTDNDWRAAHFNYGFIEQLYKIYKKDLK